MGHSIIRISLLLFSSSCIQRTWCDMSDFNICHQDSALHPPDGLLPDHSFPWLGFVQFIHMTTGLPHQNFAPRVVLIQSQFVIGTAADVAQLPKNYKLGNIIFGNYEREEKDCGITRDEIRLGYGCPRAYLEVPVIDIVSHPEYISFGVGNSLAILKMLVPMKSRYMVPVCLPTLLERFRKKKDNTVYLIDYISSVPSDMETENLGQRKLKLFTQKACKGFQSKQKDGRESVSHLLCTTGCGVRPGAPIISRSTMGRFELIGLAVGGVQCTNHEMRIRMNRDPPQYIDVYPYLDWIMNVITANKIPKAYPHNFRLIEGGSRLGTKKIARTGEKCDWNGRIYMCGDLCFRDRKSQRQAAFFYLETFQVKVKDSVKVNVELKISAGIECTIACARLSLPNRLNAPSIIGVGTYNITIKFETDWLPFHFFFSVGLHGINSTDDNFATWMADRDKGYWHMNPK